MIALLALLIACPGPEPVDTEPDTLPWSPVRARLAEVASHPRGLVPQRVITHIHSPWSHDACDGDPIVDGAPNAPCLADLRRGLCEAAIDVAFFSDHPSEAAFQDFGALWHPAPGDAEVISDGEVVGGVVPCEDGTVAVWLPGFEDELMPLGVHEHVPGTAEERHHLLNETTVEAVQAMRAAGGLVFQAHTEQRTVEHLRPLFAAGMTGVELFNAHAMFAPNLREEYLGLDGLGWAADIGPFTRPDATAEPDLLFLGVLQIQAPSLAVYDGLLQDFPVVGIAGTDAHQNVLPLVLRDGERVDSYRRALTWFSNHVLADSSDPADVRAALAAGRSYVAFEVLGVPDGFDFTLTDPSGDVYDMGREAPAGTLSVKCPGLAARFPHGLEEPEVSVTVFKDGVAWATGCGEHATDGPGAYRVQVDVVPWHLRPFLGEAPEAYLRASPWILSNAIRVR